MIEIRTDCKVCGGDLPNSRFRTYCSAQCRQRYHNKKNAEKSADWQRARRDKEAMEPSSKKIQCFVCGKWYVQVCSHAYNAHGLTGREYREKFDLDVKRGVVPSWYRKLKGDITMDNKTFKNLEKGAKYRFKAGSKTAGRYTRSKQTEARLKKNRIKKKVCTDSDTPV